MGSFRGERPANDDDAATAFERLKLMLLAARNGVSLIGVPDSKAQAVYEGDQRILKNRPKI